MGDDDDGRAGVVGVQAWGLLIAQVPVAANAAIVLRARGGKSTDLMRRNYRLIPVTREKPLAPLPQFNAYSRNSFDPKQRNQICAASRVYEREHASVRSMLSMQMLSNAEAIFADSQVGQFWTYWNALPKVGPLPRLSDYFDRVPPNLQPTVAIVDVYSKADLRVRLFGTALVELISVELTGKDALSIYAPQSHDAAAGMAWTAVNHPCGYLCSRSFRSRSGKVITAPGIALPVIGERDDCKTVVNFTNLTKAVTVLGADTRLHGVQNVELAAWIDLGAGLPA